jgi:glutamyl/glutaminyl-tRNA synthetase
VACYQERVQLYSELGPKLGWLFADALAFDEAAQKNLTKEPAAGAWLTAFADELAAAALPPSWPADRAEADAAFVLPSRKDAPVPECRWLGPAGIEALTRAFTERIGVKFGSFVHPVRAALTGTDKGPGLFDVLFLLGRDTCVKRLRRAAAN